MEDDHYQSERARLKAQQDGLQAELVQLGLQAKFQSQRVQLLEMIVTSGEPLAAKGLLSQIDQRRREDSVLEARRALSATLQQVQERQSQVTQARFTFEQTPFAHSERIRSMRDTLAATEQRLTEVSGRLAYVVRAPIAGEVALLEANIGQAADPKRLQAEVVPSDSPLQAELYVSADAIGLIRNGQHVRLRYDAFPYLRYGSYHGHVVQVSHTALTAADNIVSPLSIKEAAVYRVTVALDDTYVSAKNQRVKLQPDMLLKADVLLENRTIASWLLNAVRIEG
jgi:membrane fusion protein